MGFWPASDADAPPGGSRASRAWSPGHPGGGKAVGRCSGLTAGVLGAGGWRVCAGYDVGWHVVGHRECLGVHLSWVTQEQFSSRQRPDLQRCLGESLSKALRSLPTHSAGGPGCLVRLPAGAQFGPIRASMILSSALGCEFGLCRAPEARGRPAHGAAVAPAARESVPKDRPRQARDLRRRRRVRH